MSSTNSISDVDLILKFRQEVEDLRALAQALKDQPLVRPDVPPLLETIADMCFRDLHRLRLQSPRWSPYPGLPMPVSCAAGVDAYRLSEEDVEAIEDAAIEAVAAACEKPSRRPLPPQETLRTLFSYDEGTGAFSWRRDSSPAGWEDTSDGGTPNRRVRIGDAKYEVSRLIWCWWYGEDPGADEINHRDGDRLNLAISNLVREPFGTSRARHQRQRQGVA